MPPAATPSAPALGRPFVRATALVPVLRHFEAQHEALAEIVGAEGLDLAALRDPYEEIPLSAYLTIFEGAARAAKDPVLGARLGRAITPADLGPTGLLLAQSATIRRGLHRFMGALAALQSATEMTLTQAKDDTGWHSISYQIRSPTGAPGAQDAEFSLSCLCQLLRLSFDRHWAPEEVHFTHAPSRRPDLLERLFGAPVRFEQSANRILFDTSGLDTPHRTEDAGLIAVIERHVADLVHAQDPERSVTERVQLVISRNLGHAPVDLATVSAALGMAPRSLQRHLAAEGSSLRDLVRAQRQTIADQQLSHPGTRLKAVAATLGYSDETVFWRAFRDWTGDAPSRRRS
ncbi:AraC family transcriptional regulator [Alloyangia pacifica]|uniref:AraC family transcriptional regulator n=1 Tax=Alloyangia pacifica TaxID=311180 RepID=UPI001CD60162|nr:AraC family transcriptional regulator [Alloyangia pacifica]MCA0996106.1 AraC family transcriptional regulator ligand-binding domain-containing protein [Alloyangia pacifica]